ncbi:hypothetical protein EDF62_1519 [Leucobacter luti]|uniref:Uncharacterized protein n=1 Tax=Leucobacter luti TaxID=340320 RepID=A0A4R6RZF6_9MICO|nr:hypothetical protein [Leucobacter luti]TDP92314.1 hypothetical protein EDF62_1519 [Leucobacter luti]
MKAKYAAAIRHGIQQGRKTRYGEIDDPYYELRSGLLWSAMRGGRPGELQMEAFKRTWQQVSAARIASMTMAEKREAERAFKISHERFTETRAEREKRLLREEVSGLRAEVAELKAQVSP